MTGRRHKFLVSGGNGFLVGSMVTQAPPDWTVVLVFRRDPSQLRSTWIWRGADAETCALVKAKFAFCSTDHVLDDQTGRYRESDAPNPVNRYGSTRYPGEQAVIAVGELRAVIARFNLVMGMPLLRAARSFLVRVLDNLATGGPVWAVPGEIRMPIDVVTLGRALLGLSYRMERVDLTRRLVWRMGEDPDRVRPIAVKITPDRARCPVNVLLDTMLAESVLRTPFVAIESGFRLVWQR